VNTSLQIGQRLGSYEITTLLGKGGMGEVYRARDTKLKREVAIKVLPDELSHDADRVRRFRREAEVLASLNHPNIAAIHSLEEANGSFFLVLELVEGETLDDRIRRGPIPVGETQDIAQHLCEALEAAHEKGIVHRDLKPANIKLTPNNNVKVLDFGLARVREAGSEAMTRSNSPTLMTVASGPGMILGTAAYMAPEQACGKAVDKRADIWAFGVIMYEMLSGNRLYKGETVADTLAAVLHEEPDLEKVPVQFRLLLQRCLEKDPKKRLRDIGDAMPLIISPAADAPSAPQAPTLRLPWAVAAVFGLAALALAAIHFLGKPPARPAVSRFQTRLPVDAKFRPGGSFTISPDGRHVAFSALNANNRPGVWLQDLDALDARELAGAVTGPTVPPFFWSPDSRYVVYSENSPKLKKVDITTGTLQDICDKPGPPIGGSWNKDGLIIFGSNTTGLWKVSATGGTPAPLTKLDDSRHQRQHELPSFLPDGHHFLYLGFSATNPEESGIFAGSIDDAPDRQSKKRILATSFGAYYVPGNDDGSGWLLFLRDGSLIAQPFDSAKLELSGEPAPIAEEVGSAYETGYFSASVNALVYRTSPRNLDVQLTWFDRRGMVVGKVGESGSLGNARISPDESQVAYLKAGINVADQDIWLLNLKRDSSTRLTLGPRMSVGSVWSPDGSEIVFASNRDGVFNLFRKPTNGGREEQLLLRSDLNKLPQSWSPDGRFLLYATSAKSLLAGDRDLWILPMQEANAPPFPFQQTRFDEGAARFSTDGRWIAYTSNESGRYEIYVREFSASPGSTRTGGKWLVSKDGGTNPEWRSDGKELTYINHSGNNNLLMSVSVDISRTFEAGTPKELFRIPQGATTVSAAGDLKRFLIPVPVETKAPQAFNIVLNWTSLLKIN
jgi:serine/threonine protein kinase